MPTEPPVAAATSVRVWDLPVRLFHWVLVALLGYSWWSGEHHDMDWHRLSGYTILALIVFRIYWGVFGSRTARFAQFVRGPRAAFTYLGKLGKRPYEAADGHNPIGGWSVILMLAALSVMVLAGLFAVDVDGLESGPLADYVSFDTGRWAAGVHHLTFNVLLALVALHVAAILFYLIGLRHNLVTPMLHGRRRAGAEPVAERLGASPLRAVIGIVIAGGLAYAVAKGFRL
jgi:cytochrome b